jgi:apolipoprotein N-acyltransferase
MLFPWDFSINWIYGGLKGYEFMDLMGAQGLHAVTVFINASFLFSFLYLIKNRSFKPLVSTFSFLFFFNVAGYLYSFYAQPKADSTFYATLAQSNIGNVNEAFKTYGMGYKSEIINTYLDLSREALSPKSQLLIWPETAYPQIYKSGFKYHSSTLKTIGFLKQNNVPLLSGIYAYNEKNKRLSNSALFFAADGSFPHPPVKKVHLLAFGEYMPFEKVFPILRKLFPMVGNFEPGPGPQVLDIGGVKLGVQICYESFFTAFSRGLAEKDAQIIVNLTNDSWYGRWSEPKQHLYSLLARSIETRLPIIRATNTGISTVLLPNSKIVEPSSVYTKWSKTYEVPYLLKPKKTFYQRLGFLLTLPLLLSVFILSIVYGKK